MGCTSGFETTPGYLVQSYRQFVYMRVPCLRQELQGVSDDG
jgi:hypothetical protein